MTESSTFDAEAFARDVRALRRELDASLEEEDAFHMLRMERWGKIATAVGAATAWMGPNPVSMVGLSLGRSTRWLLMHHVGHRGYDKVPGAPERLTSKRFAKGSRRFLDWADWMLPEAWCHEHNHLHHSHTGELLDPDLVEENTESLRSYPRPVRLAIFAALASTWRASYYAPKTLRAYLSRRGETPTEATFLRELVLRCYLPAAGFHFGLFPALYLPLGPLASLSALANSIGADVLTNLHTFFVVGPNHSGEDIHRWDTAPTSRADGLVRQVLGTANYATGGDARDFLHLWLNYQIEHHLFPDLPMRAYQRAQPLVKALCEKHGLPYVQESVVVRFVKLFRVVVGDAQMIRHRADEAVENERLAPRLTLDDAAAVSV